MPSREHSKKLKGFLSGQLLAAERAVRDTVLDTHAEMVDRSPVDKGFLRANHQISINSDIQTQLDTTQPQTSAIAITLSDFEWGDTIYFVNNLPYARKREFEGGKTAPAGMMRIPMSKFLPKLQSNYEFYSRST